MIKKQINKFKEDILNIIRDEMVMLLTKMVADIELRSHSHWYSRNHKLRIIEEAGEVLKNKMENIVYNTINENFDSKISKSAAATAHCVVSQHKELIDSEEFIDKIVARIKDKQLK